MNIIQTKNLTRRFGRTLAADEVSLNVRQGEIYGFLGLNGAGKTTIIRLLLGLIKQDSGSVSLFGKNPDQGSDIWKHVGYMVESSSAYPDLSVKENLEIYYHLRGLKNKKAIEKVINTLRLSPYKEIKARNLSLGNKQRLGLAKALIHNPKLLLLDEPINGLDPSGIVEIREFLKELVLKNNTTIFLSSHILSEISKLATRIGVIHHGKLIKEINSEDLDKQTLKRLIIRTTDNKKAKSLLTGKGIVCSSGSNDTLEIPEDRFIERPELIASLLVESGLPLRMLNLFEEDLESYFLRIISQ